MFHLRPLHGQVARPLLAAFLALGLVAPASGGTAPDAAPPVVLVGPELRTAALDLPQAVVADLGAERWEQALAGLTPLDVTGASPQAAADHAFLSAWCLVQLERYPEATAHLPRLDLASAAPWVAWLRAEILRNTGDPAAAIPWLDAIPEDSVIWRRGAVARAELLEEIGHGDEALDVYRRLADAPDPSEGTAEALLALARHHGAGTPEAYPLLRRIWVGYPKTGHAIAAAEHLNAYAAPTYRPTWEQVGERAYNLMERRDYAGAVLETGRRNGEVSGPSPQACRFVLARGRSLYMQGKLTDSIAAFGDVKARCEGVDGDDGARALYLQGKARFRKGQYTAAASTFGQIPVLFGATRFADDGWLQRGIALQEAEDVAGAQDAWRRAVLDHPGGDTTPESAWRLAFSLYDQGRAADAVAVADALGAMALDQGPKHVPAGRYWAARWRVYPDVAHPHVATTDAAAKAEAVSRWRALCEELPHDFYALLAYSRLKEVAPEVAAELASREGRAAVDTARPWAVRLSFLDHAGLRAGIDLARLGLLHQAELEWQAIGPDTFTGDEMAWITELRIRAGDRLLAHDDMRGWLESHPVGTLGDRQAEVVRVAYPDWYWSEVKQASEGDRFDPRLFHALVREESNFNRTIVSHAGARGLSQLMPETAMQTAGWLRMKIEVSDLDDPETNLKIGARYLDTLFKQTASSPYLSLAAYNAGGGRVKQWLARFGNVPTDEYVERIPFRETRRYVKRVMSTWQTMRWQFDEGDAFADLSAYNHRAQPDAD